MKWFASSTVGNLRRRSAETNFVDIETDRYKERLEQKVFHNYIDLMAFDSKEKQQEY